MLDGVKIGSTFFNVPFADTRRAYIVQDFRKTLKLAKLLIGM
jgi:hypothetical protein